MQTTFEYNLEFINNKRHSIPAQVLKNDKISDRGSDDWMKMSSTKDESDSWLWWWWTKWLNDGSTSDVKETSDATVKVVNVRNRGGYVEGDEEIIGSFGESWDVCRPCSEDEMIHAYCSSDLGTTYWSIFTNSCFTSSLCFYFSYSWHHLFHPTTTVPRHR